jgi:hypothetical protein
MFGQKLIILVHSEIFKSAENYLLAYWAKNIGNFANSFIKNS